MGLLSGRLFWVAVFISAFAYVLFQLFGSMFIVVHPQRAIMRDEISAGQHNVSGTIMLPTPCDQLSVHTVSLSPNVYTLELTTWRDPSVQCPKAVIAHTFKTIAFGPAFGVQFLVVLDGVNIPFDLTSVYAKKTI